MNMSFYTAALAAAGQQEKMNVISNNIANVNTGGYRAKNAVFADLVYYNMKDVPETVTSVKSGSGITVERTDTDFEGAALTPTEGAYDYGITGRGFFMLQDPANEEISYTRNGKFSLSLRQDGLYLVSGSGKLVMDENKNPIRMDEEGVLGEAPIGIFDFPILTGMRSVGNNELLPIELNGEPVPAEGAILNKGFLEQSNVSLADEMSKTIESSRAYSYVLKMIQTSDEIEQTINSLR